MAEQIAIRHIGGYALVSPITDVNVRHLGGYALVAVPTTLDRTKTGKELLLAMMLKETTVAFQESNLVFAVPQSSVGLYDKNTKISVTSVNVPYQGTAVFFYNRIEFDTYFPDKTWKLNISTATTVFALLPAINAAYGCKLTELDVVDRVVTENVTGLVLTASATSFLLKPGSTVQIGSILPTMASLVTVTQLQGFEAVSA